MKLIIVATIRQHLFIIELIVLTLFAV